MSIRVHQPLAWYMTNKHAAGYVGLFKGSEMEALERRGSFSCPGVTPCQPRWQHSLAWVKSVLSNMWWYTHVQSQAHTQGDTQNVPERMQIKSHLLLCCHHVAKAWHICVWATVRRSIFCTCSPGNLSWSYSHTFILLSVQQLFVWTGNTIFLKHYF